MQPYYLWLVLSAGFFPAVVHAILFITGVKDESGTLTSESWHGSSTQDDDNYIIYFCSQLLTQLLISMVESWSEKQEEVVFFPSFFKWPFPQGDPLHFVQVWLAFC